MSRNINCSECKGTGDLGNEGCWHCGGDSTTQGSGIVIQCDGCGDILEPHYERHRLFLGRDLCQECEAKERFARIEREVWW